MGYVRQFAHCEHHGALSAAVALLGLALCGALDAQAPHAGHAAAATARVPTATVPSEITSDGGTFALGLATAPAPIRLNEPFALRVVVRAALPAVPGPLSVDVDATMPAHRHGMNTRPHRERLDGASFAFYGLLFHMSGEWEIVLEVAQGGVRERAVARLVIE